MKKILFALLVVGLILALNGCAEDTSSGGDLDVQTLALGTQLLDIDIASDGMHWYKFVASDADNYYIELTGLGSDMSWILYDYISDYSSDYDWILDMVAACDDYSDDTDETDTVYLTAGTYLLAVSENDDLGASWYDLKVDIAPIP